MMARIIRALISVIRQSDRTSGVLQDISPALQREDVEIYHTNNCSERSAASPGFDALALLCF
jgi:hypothetical protein